MVEVKCPVCGKVFMSKQSNYKLCSPECKKKRIYQHYHSEKYKQTRKRYKQSKKGREIYQKALEKHRVKKHCKLCGKLLPNGNQKYCFDCLLKGWSEGDQSMKRILWNRGYDSETIEYELKQRGIDNEVRKRHI